MKVIITLHIYGLNFDCVYAPVRACTYVRPMILFCRLSRVQLYNVWIGVLEVWEAHRTRVVVCATHILDTLLEHKHIICVQIRCK